MGWRSTLAGVALMAVTSAAAAAPRFASFTFENDFFAGYDRHYTNGLQLAFLADLDALPAPLRDSAPLRWSTDPKVVIAIGQRIYTPADTERAQPDPHDRPYAGWLYMLVDVQTRSGVVVDHLTLGAGAVGPASLARESQNAFHRSTGGDSSRGWDAQLRNEPTLMAGFERSWRGVASTRLGQQDLDLSLRAGGMLGNALTYANMGAVVRYGRHLPSDLPATHISLGPSRDGFRGAADGFGWYVWAGLDGRAVARNVFLDGNTFRDSPSVPRKRYGFDTQVGIVAVWPEARVGFTLVQRSREFEGQDKPDRFGQLALSFAY